MTLLLPVLLAALQAPAPAPGPGASAVPELPFPLAPADPLAPAGAGAELLAPRADVLAALAARRSARVGPVRLPDGEEVVLALERVMDPFGATVVLVDGEPTGARPDLGLTLWRVHALGSKDASGFLGLSTLGSRGWFEARGELVHLLAEPGPNGWEDSRSRLVLARDLAAAGVAPRLDCRAGDVSVLAPPVVPARPGGAAALGAPPLLECRIAVESDWQYFQLFGSLPAAQTYLATLFGAVSDRYREEVGTILTASAMGFWSTPSDPWTAQDFGGFCFDVLDEFQSAWSGGGAPVPSDLHHMVSGANLGCGVAFLPGLCDQDFGFAVSGNVDGLTPFPVAQGPLNWDFMVFAHETGHNFGSPHSHDYCPPLDQCAPSGFFGQCQTSQVCTTQGTLMSYCHLCSGGLDNITTHFHPVAADVMRQTAESSCLVPFEGILTADLGFALAGSGGLPRLVGSYQKASNLLTLSTTSAPASAPGALVVSPSPPVLTPLFGGTLVPALDLVAPIVSSPAGAVGQSALIGGSFPTGTFVWAQSWFLDGAGYAASNGLEVEIVKP